MSEPVSSDQETEMIAFDDVPINKFHIKMTALTFGAHFTDGYSLGTISIVLVSLSGQMATDPLWQGLLGSSALIGIFLGSLICGWISDRIGRQKIFLYSFVLISVSSLLQFFVTSDVALFILRVIIGFGLGGDYSVGNTLLAEFVPTKGRGVLMGCLAAFWTVGYTIANVLGAFLTGPDAWRWLLASAFVPAILTLILRIGTPESPRWLISKGRNDEARAIIDKYIGKNVRLDENDVHVEQVSYRRLFSRQYRKMTAFASLFFICDVIPYFAVYTFLPTILGAFGLAEDFTIDILLNIALLAGAFIGVWLIAKTPRRTLSISLYAISAIGLAILTFASGAGVAVLFIAFAVFTLAISAAGTLTFVFPAECFPTEARATGIGFATAMSRVASAAGTFLLPLMLVGAGMRWSMGILAAVCLLGSIMCYAWAPATEKKTLAEASSGVAAKESR